MKKFCWMCMAVLMIFSLVMIGGCGSNDTDDPDPMEGQEVEQADSGEILVYSGAGLRIPIEKIAKMFKEETGITVQFSYGGSAQCASQILLVKKGDAFLPGDVAELEPLIEEDMIDTQKPAVLHVPVLAVPTGNPAGITGIADLAKPGVRVVLGEPEANPIGKLANKVLTDNGLLEKVEPNVVARAATVNELFAYLAMEQADAAIIWEDNLVGHDKIEMVETSDFDDYIKDVPVVSLKCSENPEAARRFVEFATSDEAMAVWQECGFRPSQGD